MKYTKEEKELLLSKVEWLISEHQKRDKEYTFNQERFIHNLGEERKRETAIYAIAWTAFAMSGSALVIAILSYLSVIS